MNMWDYIPRTLDDWFNLFQIFVIRIGMALAVAAGWYFGIQIVNQGHAHETAMIAAYVAGITKFFNL